VPTPLNVSARAQVKAGIGPPEALAGTLAVGPPVPRSRTRVSSQVTGPKFREP